MKRCFRYAAAAALCIAGAAAWALPPLTQEVPYHSYTYGIWENSVPAKPVYEPVAAVTGGDLGIGAFASPGDLCKTADGTICVLDSGNRRIIQLNGDLSLKRVVNIGETVSLVNPSGICYDAEGNLYIADRGAEAVFVCTADGEPLRTIVKPESDLLDEETKFQPTKVLVDKLGVLYVLSFGSYEGAYQFDGNGDFLGFFGSNKVNVTSQLLYDRFWKLLSTEAQRERMARYVPIEYNNFAIDSEGFIYTVSNFGEKEEPGQVRKLNPLSQNILFYGKKPDLQFFGDVETTYSTIVERSALTAIDVDEQGFITVLDFNRGRVFQYDQDCNLIAIFGGPENQLGSFTNPADILSIGDNVYVLDSVKASVTSFTLTDYGKCIHEATYLYDQGFFEEALVPWHEALRYDRTNWLILRGLGRAYERLERYAEAMDYYRQGETNRRYSDAFHEYRTEVLRKHFGLVMAIIILLLLTPLWKLIWRKLRPAKAAGPVDHAVYVEKYRFPFYLCLHPFKGWEELKQEKQGSLWFANVILLAWFVLTIIDYQYTGFIFNGNRLDEMNIFILLGSTVGFTLLWSVCNWGVCTLFEGKGTFKEVWIFTSYSRLTWVILEIPVLILSNVLVREESIWLNIVLVLQTGLSILQLILAMKAAHQYTMGKTVLSSLATLLGIVLIILIILLFVSLFTQMYSFVQTLSQEILMRM